MLTQDHLKFRLRYNKSTGVFTWRNPSKYRPEYKGRPAGSVDGHGYVQIFIDGTGYKAHRLAWMYAYGVWPTHILDHKNGDRADNRLCNLREATYQLNAENRRRARSGHAVGLLGVVWRHRNQKFEARINVNKKYVYLGLFDTAEAAHAAYIAAKRSVHSGNTL
jgi:hypothetical protein